jgi:hypothetical protein
MNWKQMQARKEEPSSLRPNSQRLGSFPQHAHADATMFKPYPRRYR